MTHLTVVSLVFFLVCLFTPFGVTLALAGLVVGFAKGYWMPLFASLAGLFCQILIKTIAAAKRSSH